jgi:hypothetical protein
MMDTPLLICENENRRHDVRKSGSNGLDYLEVSKDQSTLFVYFLGKAPEGLDKENVRITGGRRFRDIQVTDIRIKRVEDPEKDDRLEVRVNKPGDFSTYRLSLVALDEEGHPTEEPFPDFDPRYYHLDFSFKAGCLTDLDCRQEPICPPQVFDEPEINYLAKDYASFRQLLLDRLSLLIPEWTERHVPDIGIALVETLAYVGDHLSYYQDAVATEAYLDTARQRISVRRHARLVDYRMHEGCNARAWLCIKTDTDLSLGPQEVYFITGRAIPVNREVISADDLQNKHIPNDQYEVFEPLVEDPQKAIKLRKAHNHIRFYTWCDRECCLPKGTTSATLRDEWVPVPGPEPEEPAPPQSTSQEQETEKQIDPSHNPERKLHLQPGDVLIFEEVIGPKTGDPADADPAHRHAVRITEVKPSTDPLYPIEVAGFEGEFPMPLLEIKWAEEDALPFPLCLSTTSDPPKCEPLEDVSVACGNVILVDHGRRVPDEDLECVPEERTEDVCPDPCRTPEIRIVPGLYEPRLAKIPLTFSQPLAHNAPAAAVLVQDPRQALPWVRLSSVRDLECKPLEEGEESAPPLWWFPQLDLLDSNASHSHFVVEMDNERIAHLRFGDGELGKQPEANTKFTATYRIGNGPAGNVGAETISHVVFHQLVSGVNLQVCNPLPAMGGTPPEPIEEVKLFAPQAFRRRLERAITPDDYAQIVLRDFGKKVQRAAAVLRWTGSWYEVLVAIDPKGIDDANRALLDEIAGHLYRYRRIGHDLVVKPARYVPLDIELCVQVLPDHLRGHVKAALLRLFSNRALPDGSLGFFHPDNLTFGEGVYLSKLVAAAQAVLGVENVTVKKFERQFEGPNGEKEDGVLPLGPLEIARLDNDPSFPENGKLVLEMGGGR